MINNRIQLEVPEKTVGMWQDAVNILASINHIPVALIMRIMGDRIEVFVSSKSEGNPYHPGDSEKLRGSGLYCETVIRTKQKLLIPNALEDDFWKNNPDVKLGMISYLGFPILQPDGEPFGTICVLDSKTNAYSDVFEQLMLKFKHMIESDLDLIFMNQVLGDKNKRLKDYLSEIQALRGLVSICSNCKSIADKEGNWKPLEKYLINHPEADFSHTICPACMEKLYPGYCKNHR